MVTAILLIVYGLALIPTLLVLPSMREKNYGNLNPALLFISIWLVMPMFLIKKLCNKLL